MKLARSFWFLRCSSCCQVCFHLLSMAFIDTRWFEVAPICSSRSSGGSVWKCWLASIIPSATSRWHLAGCIPEASAGSRHALPGLRLKRRCRYPIVPADEAPGSVCMPASSLENQETQVLFSRFLEDPGEFPLYQQFMGSRRVTPCAAVYCSTRLAKSSISSGQPTGDPARAFVIQDDSQGIDSESGKSVVNPRV